MALKTKKASRTRISAPMSAAMAVQRIKSAFAQNDAVAENEIDRLADLITSKGTAADALSAFKLLPAAQPYAFARIMLLRRTWIRGKKFLDDMWMMEQYQSLTLTPTERHKMELQFGAAQTAEFLDAA